MSIKEPCFLPNSFPYAIFCRLVMFPESSFIHIVRDPVLATDDVGEKTALLMPHVFPEGQKLWCPFSRDGSKSCFLSPSLMGALSFGFSRFLKGNVSSRSQVDANISQTLATESVVSEDFWNVWAWLPSCQAYVVPVDSLPSACCTPSTMWHEDGRRCGT